ncbi:MAG TPA: phosphopantetheine-binding protein [Gemmatimonadaceae bacterium]|nr:phosphopantetheine-binding protein [Gemmatimonadaceae bacterium]
MSITPEVFVDQMVRWVNARFLPEKPIDADTRLFEHRLIDSIRVLELIAYTEDAIGAMIPDSRIRMDNFRTVRRISEVFLQEGDDVAA